MDEQVAQLLENTQLSQEGPRKQAELGLIHARTNPDFPLALARIAIQLRWPVVVRQSALAILRKFVEDNWSPEHADGVHIPIPEDTKATLRDAMLNLVLSTEDERKIKLGAR